MYKIYLCIRLKSKSGHLQVTRVLMKLCNHMPYNGLLNIHKQLMAKKRMIYRYYFCLTCSFYSLLLYLNLSHVQSLLYVTCCCHSKFQMYLIAWWLLRNFYSFFFLSFYSIACNKKGFLTVKFNFSCAFFSSLSCSFSVLFFKKVFEWVGDCWWIGIIAAFLGNFVLLKWGIKHQNNFIETRNFWKLALKYRKGCCHGNCNLNT